MLALYFGRDIPVDYDVAQLSLPADAIRDHATFRTGWIVLVLLLTGFFVLDPLGVPVSAIAAAGAVLLLAVAARGRVIETRKVLRGAPWQVVFFSLGMYLVVYGLRNAGLTDHLAGLLDRTRAGGVWGAAFGTGIIAAVLSSVMNNMPTVLVGALSIDAHATGAVHEAMVYANVIGCDLGPKLTPIGSLATLLWLHVLGQKGVRIGWGYYFKVGVTLTIPCRSSRWRRSRCASRPPERHDMSGIVDGQPAIRQLARGGLPDRRRSDVPAQLDPGFPPPKPRRRRTQHQVPIQDRSVDTRL